MSDDITAIVVRWLVTIVIPCGDLTPIPGEDRDLVFSIDSSNRTVILIF